jgi:hypothetical protein
MRSPCWFRPITAPEERYNFDRMDFTEFEQPDGSTGISLGGKHLKCVVCGYESFEKREWMLNTRKGELFNVAWANATAENYVCMNCGYIFWFMRR